MHKSVEPSHLRRDIRGSLLVILGGLCLGVVVMTSVLASLSLGKSSDVSTRQRTTMPDRCADGTVLRVDALGHWYCETPTATWSSATTLGNSSITSDTTSVVTHDAITGSGTSSSPLEVRGDNSLAVRALPVIRNCPGGRWLIRGDDSGAIVLPIGTRSCVVVFGQAWGSGPECVVTTDSDRSKADATIVRASTTELPIRAHDDRVVRYACASG
jgi:hypothetical protein